MEHYNLRSGSLVNPVVSSSSRIHDSGRTEGNRFTDLAAGDAARLTAEGNAPNLMGSGKFRPRPKPLGKRPSRPKKSVSRLNRPESGANHGEWTSHSDTDRNPSRTVAGYGVYHLGWELGNRKRTWAASGPTPVSCYSSFVGGVRYSGFLDSHPHTKSNYSPVGIFTPDISDWTATQHALTTGHQFQCSHTDTHQHNQPISSFVTQHGFTPNTHHRHQSNTSTGDQTKS